VGRIARSQILRGVERELGRKVGELPRELDEAHRREAATAEVLRVISRFVSDADYSTSPVFRAASCNNLELASSLKALAHRRAVPIDELDDAVLLLRCIGAWLICRRSDALLVLCDQVAVLLIGGEPHLG